MIDTTKRKLRQEFRNWHEENDFTIDSIKIYNWFLDKCDSLIEQVVSHSHSQIEAVKELEVNYKGESDEFNRGLQGMKDDVLDLLSNKE